MADITNDEISAEYIARGYQILPTSPPYSPVPSPPPYSPIPTSPPYSPVPSPPPYSPLPTSITNDEISAEYIARGYQILPASPPVSPPYSPVPSPPPYSPVPSPPPYSPVPTSPPYSPVPTSPPVVEPVETGMRGLFSSSLFLLIASGVLLSLWGE